MVGYTKQSQEIKSAALLLWLRAYAARIDFGMVLAMSESTSFSPSTDNILVMSATLVGPAHHTIRRVTWIFETVLSCFHVKHAGKKHARAYQDGGERKCQAAARGRANENGKKITTSHVRGLTLDRSSFFASLAKARACSQQHTTPARRQAT